MKFSSLLAVTFICLSFMASPLLADRNTESRLLKDLRPLVEKARQERAADRWLLRSLEDLVARYEWPWQREILFDNFRDDDYTHNPTWRVIKGKFNVYRRHGLHSYAEGRRGQRSNNTADERELSTEQMVSRMLMESMGLEDRDSRRDDDGRRHKSRIAKIRVNADISKAFAIDMAFKLGLEEGNELALVVMQNDKRRYGYRLRLASGKQGFVELIRVRKGRAKVIQSADLSMLLNDDRKHDLSWRQGRNGNVSVLIDGKAILSVQTKMFRDGFRWLQLNNNRGELTVRSVRISGA